MAVSLWVYTVQLRLAFLAGCVELCYKSGTGRVLLFFFQFIVILDPLNAPCVRFTAVSPRLPTFRYVGSYMRRSNFSSFALLRRTE